MSEGIPFLKRQKKHSIGKAGRASEVRLTRELGGRGRPASGAMEGAKSDFSLGQFLVEAKSTTGKSIGLKHSWLAKNAKEARSEGLTPAVMLSFVNGDGSSVMDGEYACVPRWFFEELINGD